MADEDDVRAKRAALDYLRGMGDGVLTALGRSDLSGRIVYELEPRFVSAIGQLVIAPYPAPPIIRVQWPLWHVMTDEERAETVAHEHAHYVDWQSDGMAPDHGPQWRILMARLGYPHAGPLKQLNPTACAWIKERKKSMRGQSTNQNNKATLWVKDGWIYIKTPYNQDFVNELKADIPSSCRNYLANDKVWRVTAGYHEDVMDVVRKYFGDPTVVEPDVQVVAVGDGGSDPYGSMLRVAPDEILKKVYRLIAAEIHPDKGGKPEDMVKLNEAWAEIKKEKKL